VRVVGSDGKTVTTKRLQRTSENDPVLHVGLLLDAGEYRLVSFQRVCSGNCGELEPPPHRCDYALEAGGETVALVVRLNARSLKNLASSYIGEKWRLHGGRSGKG
jgi:hypothetical protein